MSSFRSSEAISTLRVVLRSSYQMDVAQLRCHSRILALFGSGAVADLGP
jgi:hypothetical protein